VLLQSYLLKQKLQLNNMKKFITELQSKNTKDLEKEIVSLRVELAKDRLNAKVNPAKDTNALFKKRKRLAKLLTVVSQKQETESLQK
jgi:ribosomal protein L29